MLPNFPSILASAPTSNLCPKLNTSSTETNCALRLPHYTWLMRPPFSQYELKGLKIFVSFPSPPSNELPSSMGSTFLYPIHHLICTITPLIQPHTAFSLHHCSTFLIFSPFNLFFLFFLIFYLFIYERHTERGRDTGRGRSRLPAGSLMWDSILDPGIRPWAEGRCSTAEPPRRPHILFICSSINRQLSYHCELK